MKRCISLILSCASWIGLTGGQDVPDAVVKSVVVVRDTLVVDEAVPASKSGLTVDPVVETSAETARRDAADALATGQRPNITPQEPQRVTVVSVDQVVVSRRNVRDSEACVRVGVVEGRKDCRPKVP